MGLSDICTRLGPVTSPRQVLFQPQSGETRGANRAVILSAHSAGTGCEAGSFVYTERLRYCPGAHSSSLGNPRAQVAGCPWLLRPFLFSEHRGGCCHGHPAFTSFCPQVMVLNTASTPEALAVALRAQPFSWTLKPPETEWLSFLLPHEPQEAAFPQLRSAGWASEIVRVQTPGPA